MSTIIGALPLKTNIVMVRGTTRTFESTFLDSSGNPIDLSNDTTVWWMRKSLGDEEEVYYEAKGPGEHEDAENGLDLWTFPSTFTEVPDQPRGSVVQYYYAVQRIDVEGNIDVQFVGKFTLVPSAAEVE